MNFSAPIVRTLVASTICLFASLCVALDAALGVDVSIGGPISLSSIVNKISPFGSAPTYDAPPPVTTSRSDARDVSKSPTALDMSPQFSDKLRYCVVLGRVVCESNFPLESAGDVTAEITRLQEDLVGYLGVPEAKEKIELCLFRDKGSYVQFISAVFPGAPLDRPALYVKDSGPGVLMVPQDDRMILNIRHEMTHAYLNAALRNVPIWLDEGLAKYFEIPPGERGFRNPYLKNASESVYGLFGAPPSLARLEKLTRVDQMHPREYRESWSWVHFMIHYSPETQRVLSLYLKSLRPEAQEGISMQEAFKLQKKTPMKKALAKYVPDYEKKYVEHFKNWDKRQEAYEKSREVKLSEKVVQ